MRVTQNYVNVQFFAYGACIFLIGLAGVVWLLKGHPAANSFAAAEWDPFKTKPLGNAALGIPWNLTFFSFAILALLGIETPLNMGVEVHGGEKAIRTYLIWGCIIVMAAYLWTTWGNMVVVPVDQVHGNPGGAQAVTLALGTGVGAIVSLILAWVFVMATVVYNYAFARLLFVSGLERRLPHQIGRVNRNRVPANAVILQSIIASILTVLIFFVFGQQDPNKYFFVLYAGLTIVWCISTALLFLDIFFARRANPTLFEQERRAPLWVLYVSGAVGSVINILAVLLIFVGSWYPPGWPKLATWNYWMIGITLISVVAGILIYAISQSTRRGRSDVELIAEHGVVEREIAEDMPGGSMAPG
jgi:amino acid transporter